MDASSKCQPCTIANCEKCAVDGLSCDKCARGFYVADAAPAECTACTVPDCTACAGDGTCAQCARGFYRTADGQCALCTIDRCAECAADGLTCARCYMGLNWIDAAQAVSLPRVCMLTPWAGRGVQNAVPMPQPASSACACHRPAPLVITLQCLSCTETGGAGCKSCNADGSCASCWTGFSLNPGEGGWHAVAGGDEGAWVEVGGGGVWIYEPCLPPTLERWLTPIPPAAPQPTHPRRHQHLHKVRRHLGRLPDLRRHDVPLVPPRHIPGRRVDLPVLLPRGPGMRGLRAGRALRPQVHPVRPPQLPVGRCVAGLCNDSACSQSAFRLPLDPTPLPHCYCRGQVRALRVGLGQGMPRLHVYSLHQMPAFLQAWR